MLGQLKQSYALAKGAESCGSVLDAVFHRVFSVAKRVRTETRVAEAPLSVSSAAVEMAEQALGDLRGRAVLISGVSC